MNFSPELVGVGKYNGELAEWLLTRDHEVHVVTTPPYYPNWRVWTNFSRFSYKTESFFNGRYKIFRCPIYVPTDPGGLKRILHLFTFFISSLPIMCSQIFWRPNIVFLTEPPLLCSPIAIIIGFLSNSKKVLHVHDFEIDAACNLNLLKSNLLRKLLIVIEKRLMNSFTIVSTISNKMLSLLIDKGVDSNKTALLKNWTDLRLINPKKKTFALKVKLRKIYGIPDDYVVALYSGNMGLKQGLEILSSVAIRAKNDNIFFIFSGDGPIKKSFEASCFGLPNVKFIPLQEYQSFVELLIFADIHLLPQKENVSDLVMPSKLTGMLASGSPTITTAREGTDLAKIVGKCGIVTPPDDAVAFYEALKFLVNSSKDRLKLGKIARSFAEKELDRNVILNNFFKRF